MTDAAVDLSICIAGINACAYLEQCLQSIAASQAGISYEIIYVDNGSQDDTLAMLARRFPQVQVLRNPGNVGFARAYNQAMRAASGRYILLLNPDTLVQADSLRQLAAYLDEHPRTGIVGPKVLNGDGTFQAHCKRGEARPWEVICYFSGLARRFPHDPRFSGYLQTHLDENQTHDVPAISGCCMLIRRDVTRQIGLLDERFFAYQEDTDYCVSARKAGWAVTYFPSAQIVHFGGRGGAKAQPYRAIFEWHRSYLRYYRKHLARDYFFLFNWLFTLAMLGKLAISLLVNLIRREKHAGPRRG